MNTISKILLPIALLFACDTEDMEDAESNEVAAAPADHEGEGRRGRGGPMRLDTDKDGAISLAEAQGHRLADKFTELDADKDGKLSRDELHAMKGRHGKHGPKDPAERAAHFMKKFDADNDGSISASEVAEHPRLAGKFAELDADKDGKLSGVELQAMKGRHGKHGPKDPAERAAHFMARADVDASGSLSPAEVAEHPMFADKFAELDTDKDGALSMAELSAFKPEHRGERGFGHRGDRQGRDGRTDRG